MFLNDVADFHDDFSKNKGKYKEKGTQVNISTILSSNLQVRNILLLGRAGYRNIIAA